LVLAVLLLLLVDSHATETSWQVVAEQEMVTAIWVEQVAVVEVLEELIIGVCLAVQRAEPTHQQLSMVQTEQRVVAEVLLPQ
jgi:hypothetical protein